MCCSSLKQPKWASQTHSYSTHSPAMMASVATGTFPIHIHNNSKAHSRWPSTAECLPSAHRRQLCCDTFTRKPENTNPDTCRLSCDSSDGRVGGGGLTYLLMRFRSRVKSIFTTAARRRHCAAETCSSPWVLENAT